MARSEKNGDGYWSDEYKKNKRGSSKGSVNKVKRKQTRDVTSNLEQSGLHAVDSIPTRTFTKRYGLSTIYETDASGNRYEKVQQFKKQEEELTEMKETMKSEKSEERFSEWSQGKTSRVVRKALKKSQQDGLKHPFELDETDSETEREFTKQKSTLVGQHQEAVKYLESGSSKCFKNERQYFTK